MAKIERMRNGPGARWGRASRAWWWLRVLQGQVRARERGYPRRRAGLRWAGDRATAEAEGVETARVPDSAATVVLLLMRHSSHCKIWVRWNPLKLGMSLRCMMRTAHAKPRGLKNSPSPETARFLGVLLSGRQAKRSKFCDFWAGNRIFGPLNIGVEKKLNRVDLSRKAWRLHWSKNIRGRQMATH